MRVSIALAAVAALLAVVPSWDVLAQPHVEWTRVYEAASRQYESRQFTVAHATARKALAIARSHSGPEQQLMIGASLDRLADIDQGLGMLGAAEARYREAIEVFAKSPVPIGFATRISTNKLADLYWSQSRWEPAIPLYQRLLQFDEKQYGMEHPAIASVLVPLAHCYFYLKKYREAERYYLRVLPIYEKGLDTEDGVYDSVLNNLGLLYSDEKRYTEAEPLLIRSLAIKEKVLGPGDEKIGITLNNLGLLYKRLGKFTEAETLYLRALAISEKTLPETHPNRRLVLRNLAELYKATGNPDKAKQFADRASGEGTEAAK